MLLFLPMALALGIPVSLLEISGVAGSHLPILVGSVGAGWILLALEGRGPGALGFHLGREGVASAALGWAVGTAAVLVAVAGMTAMGGIRWGTEPGTAAGVGGAAASALVILTIPAAAEEALFRGYLFQASAERWGWGWTVAWTSTAFAALHVGNPGLGAGAMVNLVLAGVVLGLLVLRTGSLWWATGAHLGWNWGQVALDLPVSGIELVDVPVLAPTLQGAAAASGGGFGVEGSVPATLVLGCAAVWLWRGAGSRWLAPAPAALRAGSPVLAGAAGRRLVEMGFPLGEGPGVGAASGGGRTRGASS